MLIRMLASLLLAGLASAAFGKYYVPWLKKKNLAQPLKDEVARIYREQSGEENKESGNR